MRLFTAAVVLGALGCCLGPKETPPPATTAPSPLSQALGGMGIGTEPPAAEGAVAAIDAAAASPPLSAPTGFGPPTGAAPAPTPEPVPSTPACAAAVAARAAVSAELGELRMTLGAATSLRLDQAGQAMMACDKDIACIRDINARTARVDAYDRAKSAHAGEVAQLAHAEVGLYDADSELRAACGP